MLSLIQRVTRASVEVEGRVVGEIGDGLLALVGVEPGDGPTQVQRMAIHCGSICSSEWWILGNGMRLPCPRRRPQ